MNDHFTSNKVISDLCGRITNNMQQKVRATLFQRSLLNHPRGVCTALQGQQ